MSKRLIIGVFITFCLIKLQGQQNDIHKLIAKVNEVTLQEKVEKDNLIHEFMNVSNKGRQGGADDLKLYLEVTSPDKDITEFIRTQRTDGSWSDIDYTDKSNSSWAPKLHAIRFQVMAKSYKTSVSKYYQSKELSQALHKAMAFWFEKKLKCQNWWYNDVGIPMWMGPGFLLILDELSPSELENAKVVMKKKVNKATGQNKVWDAGNAVIYALLDNDLSLLKSSRDSIASEIYVTTNEGLQPDYSFHQHGSLMQFGNYGLAYISSMAYWARVFAGTSLAFDEEKMKCINNFILQGIRWTIWKGNMDVGACGRQVFLNAQKSKSFSLAVAIQNLIKANPAFAIQFNNFISENVSNTAAGNSLTGHTYFWRSEYTIHRTPDWFASVRMNSSRTKGIEMTNRENLQGFYAADGVMSILVDGDEYDNIFPIWNWRHLPGLTAQEGNNPTIDYSPKRSEFVGGVSDSQTGTSAMILKHDGLIAYKSYFFINNVITCLGAGVSSANNLPVITTLNQPYLKGNVTYFTDNNTSVVLSDESDLVQDNIRGVFHNKVGYYLMQPAKLHVSNKMHKGNWGLIADFYKDVPDSGKVLDLYIEHGVKPQNAAYQYCILPDVTEQNLRDFINNPTVEVLSNTIVCQAVADRKRTLCQVVFYEPGYVNMGKLRLTSANAGIVIIKKLNSGKLKISVEDPTQKLESFIMVLSGKFSGKGMTYDPTKNETTLKITLPKENGYQGNSVTVEI